jgi:hypothetical protein
MILNGAFTYWLYLVEGSKVYVGERNGSKVRGPQPDEKSTFLTYITSACHIHINGQSNTDLQRQGKVHYSSGQTWTDTAVERS